MFNNTSLNGEVFIFEFDNNKVVFFIEIKDENVYLSVIMAFMEEMQKKLESFVKDM